MSNFITNQAGQRNVAGALRALDDIVFEALDLTAAKRKEVYRAACRLVYNRINKARSV